MLFALTWFYQLVSKEAEMLKGKIYIYIYKLSRAIHFYRFFYNFFFVTEQ